MTDHWGPLGATSLYDALVHGDDPISIGTASASTYAARIAPTWEWERRRQLAER